MTRREARRVQASRHSEKTKYRQAKLVSYCPRCEPGVAKFPQGAPHVTNPRKGQRLTCPKCRGEWVAV